MDNKVDDLSFSLKQMQDNLKRISDEHSERVTLQTAKNTFNEKLRGDKTLYDLGHEILSFISASSIAQVGALYVVEGDTLHLQYAYGLKGLATSSFKLGEGLVGQVAIEKELKVFNQVPKTYFKMVSAIGEEKPDTIAVLPASFEGRIVAVVELGRFGAFSTLQLKLLEELSEPIAITVNSLLVKKNMENLIEQLNFKEQELNNQIKAINKSNASIEFDLNGNILSANQIFLDILSYKEEEVVGKHHSIFIEKGYERSKEYLEFWSNLRKGEYQQGEFKRIDKNGQIKWIQGNYNPIFDVSGNAVRILKIANDITTSKKQQIEIDAITKAIYNSNATVEFDLGGFILNANDIFLNLVGYTRAEVIGKHHTIFVDEETKASKEYNDFWLSLRKGEYQQGEFRRTTKNGEPLWIRGNYNPIFDLDGKPYKVLKISLDITTAKKRQIEIDAITKAIYRSNAVLEMDLNGIILNANDIFLAIMGYEKDEVIGKHHSMFVEPGYRTSREYLEFWEQLKSGEFQQNEYKRVNKAGHPVWIKGNYNPIFDTDEKTYKVLKIATDITLAKKQAEELAGQTRQLEKQQEELAKTNNELMEKTKFLERSEEELKTQQEELQQTNEELEEKANLLEEQKEKLEQTKIDIENKARALEEISKYKSEFLANMSHELRTPLNSILILSKLLAENKQNVLGEKQVEFARNIYSSGSDLLNLINEILDLSKVEAGKMEIDNSEFSFDEITADVTSMFSEVAKSKGIKFEITVRVQEYKSIRTDKLRLEQILRNLLSNAFKFTDNQGHVTFTISRPSPGVSYKDVRLNETDCIAFAVKDNGIGVRLDKQAIIFEAFQQADGSTKRKYGGTGLGLSISRELANALGGEIHLESREGEGSLFTLYLPVQPLQKDTLSPQRKAVISQREIKREEVISTFQVLSEGELGDDRHSIHEGDKKVLIIEDDGEFAKMILGFVRERGYKGIIAQQGNIGLSYARYYKPDAIILDLKLPVIDGADVLRQLKNDPSLRHIPVQIISSYDRKREGMELGAFDYINKPISKETFKRVFDRIEDFINKKLKKLLIVEDNELQNKAIRELIANPNIKCISSYSGSEAYEMLKTEKFDCTIIDLGLPDMSGFDLLEKMKADEDLNKISVVVYTGKDLTKHESSRLDKLANAVVLKTADSHERLLDETILFLHQVESKLPEEKQNIIRKLHKSDEVLKNKQVLVVDDDIRNIYSLTNALEEEGMNYLVAENGKAAIAMLKENPLLDIVLMDVMMPEMDGYDATREIRKIKRFERLPVIALTAKAMKGDREKCLAAGMSDYISKPVDIEQLLSLMRVWLYRK
jgi:PAS domain S-box-containing protein